MWAVAGGLLPWVVPTRFLPLPLPAPVRDVACFDLDGTLLDPGGSIRASIDCAVDAGGFERFKPEEVLIGMPLRDILRTRTQDALLIERMVDAFREHYVEEAWRLVKWYPGVQAAVETLRAEGMQTAIVTTKGEEEAHRLMENIGATDLWDTIVGDDDVRPLKPDPAPVVAACGRLGRRPDSAVMVGDTSYDVDAGRAAGAWTIGVRWGSGWTWGAPPTGADVLVADAQELLEAVRNWRHKP